MKDKDVVKFVKKEVKELCKLWNVDCSTNFEMEDGDEDVKYVKVEFEGEDLGYMIGGHGRHLDSIQYILQIIVSKKFEENNNYRILVDVGGYRKEKKSKLEEMALQKADDVRILGDEVALPPMKPADRRVVHTALSRFEDIETESMGEGRDRYVVIKPVK